MYHYDFYEWFAFFAIYCFVGWAFESVYVSFEHKKWVNRGFLNGPFLPIYGFGAIIMLFSALPVRNSIPLTFLFGMLGATVLEYVTGYMMERIFKIKLWDYSYEPLNLNGYICLGCSLMWGGLSLLLVRVIHEPVEKIVVGMDDTALMVVDFVFVAYFIWDLVISVRQAFDLKKIIEEQILQNEKVQRMQKRIDVMIAVAEDDKARRQEKLAETREELQEKLAESKEELQEKLAESREELQEKLARAKAELEQAKESYAERTRIYGKRAMHILKRNPGVTSKRHKLNKEELASLFKEYFSK